MQQYFIDENDLLPGQTVSLKDEDYHHLVKVMRAQVGDQVVVVGSDQMAFLAEVSQIDRDQCLLLLIESLDQGSIELPNPVILACGLSKNDKLDWIVQKGTEAGMARFVPLALHRDVVKWQEPKADKKINRLAKIAKEAAQQSHRLRIPEVTELYSLSEFIEGLPDQAIKLVAYEETAKQGDHHSLSQAMSQAKETGWPIYLVFGSEGGLEAEEVDRLLSAGFKTCSLGPRILRAETAPIYALAAISYALELQAGEKANEEHN